MPPCAQEGEDGTENDVSNEEGRILNHELVSIEKTSGVIVAGFIGRNKRVVLF